MWETATGVAATTAAGIIARPAINRDTPAIVRQPIRGTGVLRQQPCRLRTQAIAPAMEMVAAIVQVGLATEMVTGIARETAGRRRCPQIQGLVPATVDLLHFRPSPTLVLAISQARAPLRNSQARGLLLSNPAHGPQPNRRAPIRSPDPRVAGRRALAAIKVWELRAAEEVGVVRNPRHPNSYDTQN